MSAYFAVTIFAASAVAVVVAAVAFAAVDNKNRAAKDFGNSLEVRPRFGDWDCCKSVEDFAVAPFEDWAAAVG